MSPHPLVDRAAARRARILIAQALHAAAGTADEPSRAAGALDALAPWLAAGHTPASLTVANLAGVRIDPHPRGGYRYALVLRQVPAGAPYALLPLDFERWSLPDFAEEEAAHAIERLVRAEGLLKRGVVPPPFAPEPDRCFDFGGVAIPVPGAAIAAVRASLAWRRLLSVEDVRADLAAAAEWLFPDGIDSEAFEQLDPDNATELTWSLARALADGITRHGSRDSGRGPA